MILRSLSILNFKNIRDANLDFADKVNCFVGLNGQGKTNLLDAIYYLSFTKSFFNVIDSQNITHDADFAMIQGEYDGEERISLAIRRGQKKQFRRGKKDYKRLIDHIGLIPLVMVSPQDNALITDGSDERRRFIDSVIAQLSRPYLDRLTRYNALLKQRNALLKQASESPDGPDLEAASLLDVFDTQMAELGTPLYEERTAFINAFVPLFQEIYTAIAGTDERIALNYQSQLHDRDLLEALQRTHQRDIILGWTSQGIHKDDLIMTLDGYPLRQVASQGQQKTYLLALKLAQALYLGKPILLLDDIFDKLDSTRVERIVSLVQSDRFGQIFITDTDRQHLTDILRPSAEHSRIFHVQNGQIFNS